MTTHKEIGQALSRVKAIADTNAAAIVTGAEITREDRELLLRAGWLQEIIKGWYMVVRPDVASGDSTAWYANFWDFARIYLQQRFQNNYCLSAENSLELHIDKPVIPQQVIVKASHGGGKPLVLPYDTSLLMYADLKNTPEEKQTIKGVQVFTLPLALCRITPSYFKSQPQDVDIALRMLSSADELASMIIKYNLKSAANRLIGAFEYIGEETTAKALRTALSMEGFRIISTNPFAKNEPMLGKMRERSPYVNRIKSLWQSAREQALALLPEPPGMSKPKTICLKEIDKIYEHDAYNSLSIEGYRVTPELISKVENNQWAPEIDENDKDIKNALAARGYYEAFNRVKQSIEKILAGTSAGTVLENDHQDWYMSLFSSSIQAGIITRERLFGYRTDRVFIRNSRHTPPPKTAVVDSMHALFDCIQEEPHAGVAAVLAHYVFVFIHPYMDGNGRMARFLMNSLLISGGYHWTVIDVKRRREYMQALSIADNSQNFKPLTQLILDEMSQSRIYLDKHLITK